MITVRTKVFVAAERRIAENAQRLLGEVSGCLLVGQTESNDNLVTMVAVAQPHVILIQHNGPDLDAMQAIRQIRETAEQVKFLMLLADEVDFWSALESQADGYILWPTTLLATAIDVVTHGGVWLGPLITEYLLRGPGFSTLRSVAHTLTTMPPLYRSLSAREREVLNLLLDGLTNQQMATALALTVGTVKVHVRHILGKLKLDHRGQAIVELNKLRAGQLESFDT